jgi:hypothetical protein
MAPDISGAQLGECEVGRRSIIRPNLGQQRGADQQGDQGESEGEETETGTVDLEAADRH